MAMAIGGILAILFFFAHKQYKDVLSGMASALFWLVFAGGAFTVSGADVTSIYFYLFFAGMGMTLATLVATLNFHPTQEQKKEEQGEKKVTFSDKRAALRERLGMRKLERRN